MNCNHFTKLIAVTAALLFTGVFAHASEMDARIESSARESYVFKQFLKDGQIKIKSVDGNVSLKGTVEEESHKALAQETVASLPDVRSVDNQLLLKGEYPAEKSDAWIGMQVKSSLLYNRHVSGLRTQVEVEEGIVTLRGEAENQAQKDLAGEYAKDIDGVRSLNNEMTIANINDKMNKSMGERIDDASITAQIKMALMTRNSTNSFKTGIKTDNGVVTLSGKATNEASKSLATKVANDVYGVTSVINNMTIEDSISLK